MNAGKAFEQDWKNSMPENIFYYRFKDGTANFNEGNIQCPFCKKVFKNEVIRFQAKNMCDCLMFLGPTLWLVDLKTTLGKSIPFKNFKKNEKDKRLEELSKSMMHEGIKAGFIVNFREIEETYFIKANDVEYYVAHADRKSIPIDWCRENGIKINQRILKTRTRYDIKGLIEK